ncbi:hypothetical protein AB0N93_11550 [Streptomyces sp. NPDC091267]|uniref:hypothetical protein n=1 Tax=Streptomyces sp. NPDC091267 TaxID=3155195 RepID=UPI003448CDCD
MTMTSEKRSPEDTALCIARNAIPDVNEALALMKLQGPVQVGDVKDGHGTVLITLRSGDAYEFARWVRTRVPRDQAQQTSVRSRG